MIFLTEISEAVARRCSVKKVFIKISQNSQERTCVRVSLPATLLKKRLWHRFSPVNFGNFLRTPFLQSTLGRLILKYVHSCVFLMDSSTSIHHQTFTLFLQAMLFFNSASTLLNFLMN